MLWDFVEIWNNCLSASGFFVQMPLGPRKSGMPDSVDMPAPVSAMACLLFNNSPAALAMNFSIAIPRNLKPLVLVACFLSL
jgi:hypothetical protein